MRKLFLNINYGNTEAAIVQGQQMDADAQITQVIDMIEKNPKLMDDDPELKSLYEDWQAVQKGQQSQSNQNVNTQQQNTTSTVQTGANQNQQNTQTQQNGNQQNNTQQPQQQQQQSQQSGTQAHQIDEETFVKKSLFFPEKAGEISFEGVTPETMADAIATHFKVDTKQPTWAKQFLTDYNKNKITVQQLEEVKTKFEALNSELEAVPMPLLAGMKAALSGKNWREELKNFDVDYTADFNKQDEDEQLRITKRLLPDLVINDQERNKPEFKYALQLGKAAFDNHKKSIETENEKVVQRNERKKQSYMLSVEESLKALSTKYEEFSDPENVKFIKNLFTKGNPMSIFYDQQGNLKKDALERAAYALYGDTAIEGLAGNKATRKTNETVANVLGNQHSQGAGNRGGNNNNVTSQDDQNAQSEKLMLSYQPTY